MFSDDLDDKIAQILRGNFSPAKNIVPPIKLAIPVTNNLNAIKALGIPPIDNSKQKSGVLLNTEVSKLSTSVVKTEEPVTQTNNGRSPVSTELLASKTVKLPTQIASQNKETISSAKENSNVNFQSNSVNSSSHSISYRDDDDDFESGDTPTPSMDVGAMILKLKNSSRDPSPTSNSSRASPLTLTINEPIITTTAEAAQKQNNLVQTNITAMNTKKSSGIASYESPERDISVQSLADESVVDDLLFGGQGGEGQQEDEDPFGRSEANRLNNSSYNPTPSISRDPTQSDSSLNYAQSQSPPKPVQSNTSPLFRNFDRPSLQMHPQTTHFQEEDTLDLETSMDSAGLYDISGMGADDSQISEIGEEYVLADQSVNNVSRSHSSDSQQQLNGDKETEAPMTPIQIIMQQQQRLLQQQQQRQQSPLREVVSISHRSSTSPGLRRPPVAQSAARSKSPLKQESPRPLLSAESGSPASVGTLVRRDSSSSPSTTARPALSTERRQGTISENVVSSSADVDSVPLMSSAKLVINSPSQPTGRQRVPASMPAAPSATPLISPEVRMEQVYQYAENEEEEVADAVPERKRTQPVAVLVAKALANKPPAIISAPLRKPVVEPSSIDQKLPQRTLSPDRSIVNPMRSVPVASKEAVNIRAALAKAAVETETVKKSSVVATRPVSAARARPAVTIPASIPAAAPLSPLKLSLPVSKEALPGSTVVANNQHHSPTRGPLVERPVKVAVRVRPFTDTELADGARRTISRNGEKLIIVNPKAFDAEPDTIAAAAVAMDNKQWAQIFQYNNFLWARDRSDPSPPTEQHQYVNQQDVHEGIGREIVESVLHGVSASCFAYGHTGTGKTHSLFGNIVGNHSHRSGGGSRSSTPMKSAQANQAALSLATASSTSITSESGLIPRVMHDIISAVNGRDMFGSETRLFFSFVEIYNEKIIDLLVSDAAMLETSRLGGSDAGASVAASALKAREHPVLGTYVENLSKVEVSSPEEVLRLIAKGQSNRATTCTAWNTTSSRSHAIVTLELSPANYSQNVKFISPSSKNNDRFNLHSASSAMTGSDPHQHLFTRVQMVDLAGSEKDSNWGSGANSASHDEHGIWKGSRYNDTTPNKLAEATADKEKNELKLIRRSLSTLGYIIKALAKGAAFKSLPYRDSVLTFLLRDALNGHNHTTMLATISPADNCYEETLSTLRYAEKLCSLRGIQHHSHHGLPGGNHHMNVSYGSPVTSLVAADKDMMQSRKALLEEFTKIHDGLGHNRPGSNASRQLHKQTISDPQQRIAKMTKLVYSTEVAHGEMAGGLSRNEAEAQDVGLSSSGMSTPSGSRSNRRQQSGVSFTSPVDGSTKDVYSLTTSDLDALKSSYRALQGQLIETQIDVESVKADRDTLTVDLKVAREQLLAVEQTKGDSRSTIASLTRSFKAAEKEINEYRVLLRKKEESLERVVGEISSEKQGRLDAEHAYHARTKEFLTRFEAMKKENKSLSSSLEVINNKYKSFGDEKRDLLAQIEKLRVAVKTLTADRDQLAARNQALTSECEGLKTRLQQTTEGSATELADYERANSELTLLIGRLQTGLGALTGERDDLVRVVAQKDQLLGAQSQQVELTLRMMQQRQSALDMSEQTASEIGSVGQQGEDFGRLHESLRELFASEGRVLHSELLDTKKLTAMVRDLREKMLQQESLQGLLDRERGLNQTLHAKFQEFRVQSELQAEHIRAETVAQHDHLRSQLEDARARIASLTAERLHPQQQQTQYPQHPFSAYPPPSPHAFPQHSSSSLYNEINSSNHLHSTTVNSHLFPTAAVGGGGGMAMSSTLEVQLRTECNLLREQLVHAQAECSRAKEEARSALDSQQKEQASLWASMQEANRDTAAKDLALHDLATDRDRLLHERDALAERLRMVTQECAELQQDLRELDADLVAAVELTSGGGRMQGGGLALHKVPDRMMHGIMRRRQKLQQTAGSGFDQQQQQQYQHPSFHPQPQVAHNLQQGSQFFDHAPRHVEQQFGGQQSQQVRPPAAAPQQSTQYFGYGGGEDPNLVHAESANSRGRWDQHSTVQSHSQQTHSSHHQTQHQMHQSSGFNQQHQQSPLAAHYAPQRAPHSSSSNGQQQRLSPGASVRSTASSGHGHPQDDRQYDLSEKILQRQIEELSDFLDDEAKLKRSRLQRSSNGSLSSLAQSNATKRTKLYTPTTKLNFDF